MHTAMLLLLQDISSALGVAPLLSGPRASVSAITLRRWQDSSCSRSWPSTSPSSVPTRRGACARAPRRRDDPPSRRIWDFVRLVIPELQRRGLYHREYEGLTLREKLGLGLPQPRWWK